jgi:hypothetical protein
MFPMSDPFDSHVADVTAIGIDPPAQWSELLARHQAYTNLDARSMAQRLADAVIDGAGDLDILRAEALAEASATPPVHAEVDHVVRTRVLDRLREHYRAYAAPNYQQIAADFDQLARKFTAAASLVDSETDAAQMVDAPDKTRRRGPTPSGTH